MAVLAAALRFTHLIAGFDNRCIPNVRHQDTERLGA